MVDIPKLYLPNRSWTSRVGMVQSIKRKLIVLGVILKPIWDFEKFYNALLDSDQNSKKNHLNEPILT